MSIAGIREAVGLDGGQEKNGKEPSWIEPPYATKIAIHPAPSDRIPEKSLPSYMAKQLVEDMLMLDYNPRLNLASFLTTWMEDDALKVLNKALAINMADAVQYPSASTMESRCVRMLAKLWNCPDDNFIGTGCAGSTEACLLGGLACKKNWQRQRREAGLPTDKPNLIFGHNAQVAWQKFCAYFDVEARFVELHEDSLVLDPEALWDLVDENTIGVALMFGSTYNGQFEDVERCNTILEEIKQSKGWDVPIHVDAANGGIVAPVLRPELAWDFRNSHVVSINLSGHKYGLVYPGLGFQVWRSKEYVPEDMVFVTDYLGKEVSNFSMNFSRSGAPVVAQYYQFIRLGLDGYRGIFENLFHVYNFMVKKLDDTGHFDILSNGDMPVLAFRLKPLGPDQEERGYDEFDVMHGLREYRFMVPAYRMAPKISHVKLLRICLRVGFDLTMADTFVEHLLSVIKWLDGQHGGAKRPSQATQDRAHLNGTHVSGIC